MATIFHFIGHFDEKYDDLRQEFPVVRDTAEKEGFFSVELVNPFRSSENTISGIELMRRSRTMEPLAGQRHAAGMLKEMNRVNARYKTAYGECFGVALRNSADNPKVKEAEAKLDALVEENRKIIPKEWYDYTLLFPGTILNNAVPERYWPKPLFGPPTRPRWRSAIPFLWYRSDD